MHLDEVCRQTDAHRWGGRVAIGHVTKLSAIDHSRLREIGRRLADAGVAVTVLPATDLFLMDGSMPITCRAASPPRIGCWRMA
jgi:cytosine deaminase